MLRALLFFLLASFPSFGAEEPKPPEGHAPMRFGIDGGYQEGRGETLGISYRFALHDILDRMNTFPLYTSFEVLGFRLEHFPQSGKIYLDELVLFRLLRLPPITSSWAELSWKIEVGARSLKEPQTCDRCGVGNVVAGLGATVTPLDPVPIDAWFLFEAEFLLAPPLGGFPIKPSLGPRAGLRFRFGPNLNGILYGLYRRQLTSPSRDVWEYGTEWRWAIATNWALNCKITRYEEGLQGLFGAYVYF